MDKKYAYLGLGLAFVGGTALGVGGGYYYAFKKFYASYEAVLEQEIQKTKEFYSNLYKEEYPTPADAADSLIPSEELTAATVALRKYAGITVKPENLEDQGSVLQDVVPQVTVEERNVFDEVQHTIDPSLRDLSKPYVVTLDEYMEHPQGHDTVELTYYSGDNVLGDDNDEPVEDVEGLVGLDNISKFGLSDPDQPHILMVRNEKKKLDIEVAWSEGKFAHEVLGFNHSDEPMRRSRPRWDDE